MVTKKITLNELRTLVKQIIKEESEKTFNNLTELKNALELIGIYVGYHKDVNKKEYIEIYPIMEHYLSHNTFHINKNGKYEMGNWYVDGNGERAMIFNNIDDVIRYVKKNNFKTIEQHKEEHKKEKKEDEWLSPRQRIKKYGV